MSIFSNIFGGKASTGDSQRQAALDQFTKLAPPSAEDLSYQLDQLVQMGQMTPEEAQAIQAGPSAFEGMNVDPTGMNAQLEALQQLQGISRDGGMTATDRARLAQIQTQQNEQERGNREAILMNARERGVGGSGVELASQLLNSQESANRGNQAGLDVAAQAQQAALDAIKSTGQLGAQVRGQQFNEAEAAAQAKDAINKFNVSNQQNVVNANVAARNAAQAQNLAERQRVADTNVGAVNQQRQVAANAKQQAFQDATQKATGMAGQYSALADSADQRRRDRMNLGAGVLGTAANIAPKVAALSDERKKKNIEGVDMDEFLGSLKPSSFEYDDPGAEGASPGENVGVMAQDVEKTPVGRTMVKNTKGGKMLDMQKGFGVIMAALGALHDRMEQEEAGEGDDNAN